MSLAGTLYAHYFGGNGEIDYNSTLKATPAIEYPPAEQVTITGPLYVPQLYAMDLDSLEIASSGKIALTLQDVHSLDIDRDVTGKRVRFASLCNDSMDFLTATSNVTLSLDATSNNLVGTASNDIRMTAGNSFVVSAKNLAWNINGDIDFTASNDIHMYANSNVFVDAQQAGVYITAAMSNVKAVFDPATYSLLTYAASNMVATACNDFSVTAAQNVGLNAVGASLSLAAAASNATIVLDAATYGAKLYATSNVAIAASNDLHLTSAATTTLSAAADKVHVGLSSADYSFSAFATSNASIMASNNVSVAAAVDMSIAAVTGSASITADAGKVAVTLDKTADDLKLYALHDVAATASNNFLVSSVRNTAFVAGSNYALTAAQNTTITSTAGFISASAAAGTTTMGLSSAGFGLAASNDILLAANDSNVFAKFAAATNDYSLYASNAIYQTASNGFFATASTGDMVLKAAASSTLLQMTAADKKVTLWSSNDATVATSNNLFLTASNNATISADGGAAQLQLQTANGGSVLATGSNFTFSSGGNPTLFVDGGRVKVTGNLEVTGVIDSVSVQNTVLEIQDKEITVAHSSNNQPVTDGLQTNDQAGLRVEGLPASAKPADSNVYDYAKSVKWSYGTQGMDALGSSNADAESFWEMKGGSFRLTHTKLTRDANGVVTDTKDLSFGLRVNELEELELVKRYWSPTASNYLLKRVAKFGRTTTL